MKDADDNIIYVGKAISLRNRVRSYFRVSATRIPKPASSSNIADFEGLHGYSRGVDS